MAKQKKDGEILRNLKAEAKKLGVTGVDLRRLGMILDNALTEPRTKSLEYWSKRFSSLRNQSVRFENVCEVKGLPRDLIEHLKGPVNLPPRKWGPGGGGKEGSEGGGGG